MFSSSSVKRDAYEMVHVWPKVAETERFINHQQHPSTGVHGTVYTNYGDFNAAPMQSRRRWRYFGLKWWYLEILALAVSITSFVAIVIVLRIYEGRAVSELRLPKNLTLNAIVAALATISRATLMVPVAAALTQDLWLFFIKEAEKTTSSSRLSHLDVFDSASRGMWGSLVLLFHFHGRRIFASLAAVVTILSLIFGTFIQQSIGYDRKIALNSVSPLAPGNVPRAETWTKEHGRPSEGYLSPPLYFIGALYEGVLREDVASPPVSCPSGNCTWPSTPSLAICGACVPSKPTKSFCYKRDVNEYYCNYTMPSGSVMQIWNFDKFQDADDGVGFEVVASTGAHYNASKGDRAYFANFDLMGAPFHANTYGAHNQEMKAAECALWMCVQTFNTSVNAGVQTEKVVSQIDDLDMRNLAYTSFEGEDLHATFPPLPTSEDPEHSTTFKVDAAALFALRWYFASTIGGTIELNQEVGAPSSDLMYGIWSGTKNLDAWITTVAKSLTGVIRTTETKPRSQYNGTAYAMGVHVRWLWLLLPVVLIASSLLVLFSAIARTAVSPIEAWKGSPLTFLLFGLDQRVRDEAYGHGIDHHGFQKAVGAKQVRLVEEGGTLWKFKAS